MNPLPMKHRARFSFSNSLLLLCFLLFSPFTSGCAQTSLNAEELELHFIDVGQGDSVFIRAPSGQGVLYDGGRKREVPLEYLRAIGATQVDLVIASHADADHIAGLAPVVEAYQPRFFIDNGIAHTTQTYFNLLETVEKVGSQLLEPQRGASR